jgi:peptidoglycan/LPS O-acetylase OafA/YrhL
VRSPPNIVVPPGAFRLLLAAAVVLSHVSHLDIGIIAVVLFFYLSGYWVSKVWDEKFEGRNAPMFYLARYLRIAPLYLLVLITAALALGMPLAPRYLALLGVASATRGNPLVVAWSLDIELQFYLLLPLMVAAARRASPALVMVGAVAISAVTWVVDPGVVTVFRFLPIFAAGLLTYRTDWRPSERTAGLSVIAFAGACALAALTPFIDKTSPDPFNHEIFAMLWAAPLLPYVARSLHVRGAKMDRHLGNISYPLYLVHAPVISVLLSHGGNRPEGVALACIVAVALYMIVDRPVDALRVRLTEAGRIRQAAVPA